MISCKIPASPSPIQSLSNNSCEISYSIRTLAIEGLLTTTVEWSTHWGLSIALIIENKASLQWLKCTLALLFGIWLIWFSVFIFN